MTPIPSTSFAPDSPYRRLAKSLDALPNGFPPADDESDLRLLAKIFTPEQADLAANLLPEAEPPAQIAARLGRSPQDIAAALKEMVMQGLIAFGKTAQGRPGFKLMPFVVGIYEAQITRIDAELANLFEDYYQNTFGSMLKIQPQVHRVIPVQVSLKDTMQVRPFESVTALVDQMQSWGVIDCICRKQQALIGKACGHPVDVCMVLSEKPEAFNGADYIRVLDHDGAIDTLRRAADAGLVHSVSNNQRELWYICNCCTCSCAMLRGIAEMGIANAVARSAFVNQVDEDLCIGCEACVDACAFHAIQVDGTAQVVEIRCIGCGVCVTKCPQGALGLVRRSGEAEPPLSEAEWGVLRQDHRSHMDN